MAYQSLAVLSEQDLVNFGLLLFLVLLGLLTSFIYGTWINRGTSSPSPYTGRALRKGSDIHWLTIEKVLRFLYDMHDYNNRLFDFNRAAFCRDTGRIFPDSITWHGSIKVSWRFLQKRFPGNFVSWGSLTEEQKISIIDRHKSLEGFQTEFSSHTPSPRKVEKEYAYLKPGPLYVDVDSGVLLGWKWVPDTDLEVLVLQKPEEIYLPGIHKKY